MFRKVFLVIFGRTVDFLWKSWILPNFYISKLFYRNCITSGRLHDSNCKVCVALREIFNSEIYSMQAKKVSWPSASTNFDAKMLKKFWYQKKNLFAVDPVITYFTLIYEEYSTHFIGECHRQYSFSSWQNNQTRFIYVPPLIQFLNFSIQRLWWVHRNFEEDSQQLIKNLRLKVIIDQCHFKAN